MGPNESNRGVIILSTNFYQLGNSKDRDLDLRELNGSERELNGDDASSPMRSSQVRYSTLRGAVYPAFVTTVYFTGRPFSDIRNASPV
jgi:hypothetical protein